LGLIYLLNVSSKHENIDTGWRNSFILLFLSLFSCIVWPIICWLLFVFDVPMLLIVVVLYVKTLVVVLIGFRFIVDIQGQVFPMGYPINAPSPYHYLPSPLKY
jgi:hypothetical protein